MIPGTVAAIGLGVSTLFQGIAGLFGASAEADAKRRQGEFEQAMYDQNARFSEIQADDAIRRGDSAAARLEGQGQKLRGSQRAGYGGQGVDVNSGAPAEVGQGTELAVGLDANTIKSNAWREAWGYKVQAVDSKERGLLAKMGAERSAGNTLLSGGLKAIGSGLTAGYTFANIGGGGGGGGSSGSGYASPSAIRSGYGGAGLYE